MATLPVSLQGVGCPQGTPEWGQAQESPSTAFSLPGKLDDSESTGWSHRYWCREGVAPGLNGTGDSYSPTGPLQGEGWVHLLPALPSEGFPAR